MGNCRRNLRRRRHRRYTQSKGGTETETSPINVEHGKTVEFIATPDDDYKVDEWTIKDGAFEAGTGKVKMNVNTTVTVTFKSLFVPVAYGKLVEYLAKTRAQELTFLSILGQRQGGGGYPSPRLN